MSEIIQRLWPFLLFFAVGMLCSASDGGEVLPPEAYINRTLYPPLMSYPTRPHLSLGILSDVQYADQDEHKRRHFRKSLEKLQHAVAEMNANRTHLDMVIHLGDLVDHSMEKFLPIVEPVLKQLKYPVFQLLGNHDFLGTAEEKFERVHKMLGMPARYYSLNAGPSKSYRLLMLDGNDIALYSTVAGSPKRQLAYQWKATLKRKHRKNAQKFNGALSDDQILWMQQQMSEACNASQRVLVFLHHPMRPVGEPTNLWNDLEVVPIITSFPCVVAVINGHAHKFLYDFHHTKFRDVHFVTFGGMVQSPFTSWGFVEVYEDTLHVHGLVFGRAIDFKYDISSSGSKLGGDVAWAGSALENELQGQRAVEIASLAPRSGEISKVPLMAVVERTVGAHREGLEDVDLPGHGLIGRLLLGVVVVVVILWVGLRRQRWKRSPR